MPGDLAPLNPALVRAAFDDAARGLVATAAAVRPDQWSLPGLGVWTVQELTGHALRALTTVESYLDVAGTTIELTTPEAYFSTVFRGAPDLHAAVAERGRQAGAALGDEPAVVVGRTALAVLERVAATSDDAPCATAAGGMALVDYLPSRVVELTVHTLDLARATGQALDVAVSAWTVTVTMLVRIADPARLVLALTGRGDYNVLA